MSWEEIYRSRLTTAEEAVTHIRSGDRVVLGHAAGEPTCLTDAMVRSAAAYRDVEIDHMLVLGGCAVVFFGLDRLLVHWLRTNGVRRFEELG